MKLAKGDKEIARNIVQLNDAEIELMVSQNVIPNKGILGGSRPMAFTEQEVAMLSSVLRNKKNRPDETEL